jgi:hypothetical protein
MPCLQVQELESVLRETVRRSVEGHTRRLLRRLFAAVEAFAFQARLGWWRRLAAFEKWQEDSAAAILVRCFLQQQSSPAERANCF